MNEPTWLDQAAAYVLGALDDDERTAFEARLAADAALRAEVDAYREVAAEMADAAPRVAPSADLKRRILEQASAVRPAHRRRADPGIGRALALAALFAALALGAIALWQNRGMTDLERRLRVAQERLDSTQARLAARDSLLATFLGPDVRVAALSATDQAPSARIYWNTATATMMVAAFDLPPARDGRVYQLWGIAPGSDPVSLGTFQTEADGTALIRRTAPAGAEFQIGAVTEEPTGGSPQPTSAPFLVGTWTGQ